MLFTQAIKNSMILGCLTFLYILCLDYYDHTIREIARMEVSIAQSLSLSVFIDVFSYIYINISDTHQRPGFRGRAQRTI